MDLTSDLCRAAGRSRRLLEVLIVLALLLMASCAIWGIFDPATVGEMLRAVGARAPKDIAAWQTRALDGLLIVQIGVWTGALIALRSVFAGMHREPPFPPVAVRGAQRAFRWILAGFGLSLLGPPIASVVSTWHMPPGRRELSIHFGSSHALTLIALTLTAMMSRAFSLAAELWQDHQEIV